MTKQAVPVVIFDTGVVLQAILNPSGPAADAIDSIERDSITAYMSHRLRAEYENVLNRPAIRAKNPLITDAQVVQGLARFDEKAVTVSNPPPYLNYPRDPNDEHVINLAIHVEAEFIVTRDRDLLDLMDETQPNGRFFRQRFPRILIVDPVAFLHNMTRAAANEGE